MKTNYLKPTNQFDWVLFFLILLLSITGIVNLYSATRAAPSGLFGQQISWYFIAFFMFFLIAFFFQLRILQTYSLVVYFACLGLLILALFLGKTTGASTHLVHTTARWIKLSDITVQPSEFMKLGLIIACAKLFSMESMEYEFYPWRFIIVWHLLVFSTALFVIKQPDLGTGLLCLLIGMSMFLTSRLRFLFKFLVLTFDLAVAIIFFIWGLKRYQLSRIAVFLEPKKYVLTEGFQIDQAISAIGSGQFFGKGFLHGTQNQLHFLPVQWTDFVFAVFAEEWGFIGCLIVLILFWCLVLWLLHLSKDIKDQFMKNLLIGCTSLMFWHTIINIAMVCRLLPVVGINLPLFSYGGSNLLTLFMALGICMNISMRRTSQGL